MNTLIIRSKAPVAALLVLAGMLFGLNTAVASETLESLKANNLLVAAIAVNVATADPAYMPVAVMSDPTFAVASPDSRYTPGNLCNPRDTNFKEYRYPEHVAYCQRNVSKEMKQQVAKDYGDIPESQWPKYEFDHLIPLGIGGNSSIDNLWPQPRGTENDSKNRLENDLCNQLAAGAIKQVEAVRQIYAWFDRYVADHPELPAKFKTGIEKRMMK